MEKKFIVNFFKNLIFFSDHFLIFFHNINKVFPQESGSWIGTGENEPMHLIPDVVTLVECDVSGEARKAWSNGITCLFRLSKFGSGIDLERVFKAASRLNRAISSENMQGSTWILFIVCFYRSWTASVTCCASLKVTKNFLELEIAWPVHHFPLSIWSF